MFVVHLRSKSRKMERWLKKALMGETCACTRREVSSMLSNSPKVAQRPLETLMKEVEVKEGNHDLDHPSDASDGIYIDDHEQPPSFVICSAAIVSKD